MPTRSSGYRPGVSLRLQVEDCRGCGGARDFLVKDVREELVVFECPRCGREERLYLRQMIRLAQRDQERLERMVPSFLLERRWFAGWSLGVSSGFRLRLTLPGDCPGCRASRFNGARIQFWLKDVYETGPLFACPSCDFEWHLHLEQIVAVAVADQLALGRPANLVRQRLTERLIQVADRRKDEAFAALREEALRRGYHPRELPWAVRG